MYRNDTLTSSKPPGSFLTTVDVLHVETSLKLTDNDGARVENDLRGDIAHTRFDLLCLEARATPNRVQRDLFGWDTHVTLRLPHAGRASLELRDTERRVMVQVKARTPDDWSVPLRVSNAERMVKEEVPWFLFVARFPVDTVSVNEFFLVHVDEGFVSRVLKRLRELDRERVAQDNRHDVVIPFDDSHRVSTGEELRRRLEETLLAAESAYTERKRHWRSTVGFDEAPVRGTFTVRAKTRDAMYKQMADWRLGLAPLTVDSIELATVRFGIADEPKVHRDVTLHVPESPSLGSARVEFFDDAHETHAFFEMAVHTTAGIPTMPTKHHRFRFVAPLLVVTLHDLHKKYPSATLEFAVPEPEIDVDLVAAQHIGALVGILRRQATRGMRVRVAMPMLEEPWEFLLPRMPPPALHHGVELFAMTARAAARLFSEFGFAAGGVTSKVRALARNALALNTVAEARCPNPQIGRAGVNVDGDRPPQKTPAAVVARFALRTNRGVMLGLAVLVGEVKHPRRGPVFDVVKLRVLRSMLKLVGNDATRAVVNAQVDGIVENIRTQYEVVIGGAAKELD